MPRNVSGVYSLPSDTAAVPNAVADANDVNARFNDIVTDLNAARPVTAGGTGGTTKSAARAALGLAIGTNVQAFDPKLQALSALKGEANAFPYMTGEDTMGVTGLTSFARTLLDDGSAAVMRTTLGAIFAAKTQIGSAADLDTLPEGLYAWGAGSNEPVNAPFPRAFMFQVSAFGNIYQAAFSGAQIGLRSNTGAGFGAWTVVS